MFRILICGLATAMTLMPDAGQAATVNTIYKVNGNTIPASGDCTGSNLDAGLGITGCMVSGVQNNNYYTTEMYARADELSLGVTASTLVIGSGDQLGGSSVGGTVSHTFLDTLQFTVSSGTLLLPVDIFGSLSVPPPPGSVSGGGGTASAFMGVDVFADGAATEIFQWNMSKITGQAPIETLQGQFGTTVLALGFENGSMDLALSLFGGVGCIGRWDGGQCDASVDFFQSARLLGVTVLDDQGRELSTPQIQSLSGFNYLTGAEPHDLPPAVPLPAAGWMLLASIAGLLGLRRRAVY